MMNKHSSIGQVNFRKIRAKGNEDMFLPDYASAENVLGKNASGLLNVNSR